MHGRRGERPSCGAIATPGRSQTAATTKTEANPLVPTTVWQIYKGGADRDCCDEKCTRWKNRCGRPRLQEEPPPSVQRQSWRFPRGGQFLPTALTMFAS